jgi:hypothetical protein
MSVTFSVEGASFEGYDDPRYYNVANGSARRILSEMLNVEDEWLCGDLDPHEVLRRFAVVRPENHVEDGYEEQRERVVLSDAGVSVKRGPRVIFQGINGDRVSRWIEGLSRVAELAIEAGVRIGYG